MCMRICSALLADDTLDRTHGSSTSCSTFSKLPQRVQSICFRPLRVRLCLLRFRRAIVGAIRINRVRIPSAGTGPFNYTQRSGGVIINSG